MLHTHTSSLNVSINPDIWQWLHGIFSGGESSSLSLNRVETYTLSLQVAGAFCFDQVGNRYPHDTSAKIEKQGGHSFSREIP